MTGSKRSVFPSLIGNERIRTSLAADFASGHCAHAYILEGADGSGKHTAADLICAAVLCENRDDPAHPLPCGNCSACRKVLAHKSVDVMTLSNGDKASIGVEAVRLIRENLFVTPNDGEKKFFLIENAHLMTTQAQNALLLSLEEPPPYVMFLLLCSDASLLLETVRSRAPVIPMEVFSPSFTEEYLTKRYGTGARRDKIVRAAHLSGGSLGKAADLYENDSEEMKQYETAAELVEILLTARRSDAAVFAGTGMPKDRKTVCRILSLARVALRDIIADKKNGELLFYSAAEGTPSYAKKISLRRILELSDAVAKAEEAIAANCSQNTVLLTLLLGG